MPQVCISCLSCISHCLDGRYNIPIWKGTYIITKGIPLCLNESTAYERLFSTRQTKTAEAGLIDCCNTSTLFPTWSRILEAINNDSSTMTKNYENQAEQGITTKTIFYVRAPIFIDRYRIDGNNWSRGNLIKRHLA